MERSRLSMARSLRRSSGDLADIALRCAQDDGPLRDQCYWEKRGVPGTLQADKLGNVFEVLAENVLFTARQYRHGVHTEFEQLLFSRRIVHDVNRDKVNAFFRKKLFRSQATASTRLGEQDKIVSDALHDRVRHC